MELLLLVILALYFLPTIVAMARNSTKIPGVVLVNLLLGWTLLGWVFALVWAVSSPREAGADPTLKKCPACAELIKREAKVCKHCGTVLPG